MAKKIGFGLFVTACLVGILYWFHYVKEVKAPVSDAMNAIPSNASVIIECNNIRNSWDKISHTNLIWQELQVAPLFANIQLNGKAADSILNLNPELQDMLEDHPFFISFHADKKNQLKILYSFSLPNLTLQSSVEAFFKKLGHDKEPVEKEGAELYQLNTHGNSTLYVGLLNGTIVLSSDNELVGQALLNLRTGNSILKNENFKKLSMSAGKKVDANVYINYSACTSLIAELFNKQQIGSVLQLKDFAEVSEWDLNIRPNTIQLNGFTLANDSTDQFLSLFSDQKPQEVTVTSVLPSKTAAFSFFGFSDFAHFYQRWHSYPNSPDKKKHYQKFITDLKNNSHLAVEEDFIPFVGNEMAMATNENGSVFLALRCENKEKMAGQWQQMVKQVNEANELKNDTSQFMNTTIGHLPQPDLFPNLFGTVAKNLHDNYYCFLDDYLLVANDPNDLKSIIADYRTGRTLKNNQSYQSFSENLSAETSVFCYTALPHSATLIKEMATPELADFLEKQSGLLPKFEAAGIQFSSSGNRFFCNACLKYNPVTKTESSTLWECKLDTTISSKPFLLLNHNTKAKDIFVQDDANKIYLISNTGQVIWTKQLNEKIMSDVTQVDVLKNNKLQMIFNTRSFIYMFDRNGNDMKGFPIKLRSPATNAISVVDYENNRDYRIFIATENKRIVCYKANGDQLTAFKFDKTKEQVFLPIQFFTTANKDHLCAVDKRGNIYILNRQGEVRIKMKDQFSQGIRNFYCEIGKDYSRTFLVAADTVGTIVKIKLNGGIEKIKCQEFDTSPYFDYKDINNDKTMEYLFLTRNELKVFSSDRSLLFHSEFETPISTVPQVFLFPDGTTKIGVCSDQTNEIFLFLNNGVIDQGFPLKGKTPFSIGDINNEGQFYLVAGSVEGSILVYPLN